MPCLTWQRELRLARQALHKIPDPDAVLAALPIGADDTCRVLAALLAKHNHRHAAKDKGVSDKTMTLRGDFLFNFFRQLREKTRFRRIDPRELRSAHVTSMVSLWVQEGKSTGTIHVYLSYLRVFSEWIGKPGMVHSVEDYLGKSSRHAHRSQVAKVDHSWQASGVDAVAKIAEAAAIDSWVGLQLELMLHFGLRAKEAMFFRPTEAVRERESARQADAAEFPTATHFIRLRQGTKGGRVRDVPILTDAQRELLDRCQRAVPAGGFVGRQHHTPQQARDRFYWVLRRIGITKAGLGVVSHGLRHGYANDMYENIAGVPSPVRAANGQAVPASGDGGPVSTEAAQRARMATSRALGHGRERVTVCYLGTSLAMRPQPNADGGDQLPLPEMGEAS